MKKEDRILCFEVCILIGVSIFLMPLLISDALTSNNKEAEKIEVVISNIDELKQATATPSIIYIETETEEQQEETEQEIETKYTSLGEYKLTAYCPCEICCGKWSGGNTASGTKPQANRTVAVDKSIIPFGTTLIINGAEYVAEDTGNFKGKHIDIYFDNHSEAVKFGVQRKEIFIKND